LACVALVIDMREIDYKQSPGITHEQELELLANVYRLALESYREKRTAACAPGNGLGLLQRSIADSPPEAGDE
jgi:hypothetical protein